MMTTDRRLRHGEAPVLAMAIIWALAAIAYLAFRWNDILTLDFPDADDAMRLVQVRDLIAGQGWFDLHQYRVAPPDGAIMHWSRIVDLPLAALIVLLRPLLGQELAEMVTSALMPLMLLGATMAVLGRTAWRLLGKEAAIFTCVALPLMPLVLAQFGPLRIDHHAWQILACAVGLWGLSWRDSFQGARIAGLAMAVGTMISLELLPMTAVFGFVLLARWISDQRMRMQLPAYLQVLCVGQIVLFALTRGSDFTMWCDAVSPAHLAFFCIAALGTTAIARLRQLAPTAILFGLGLTGAAAIAWFAASAPQCVGSPFGNLNPLVREYWYLNVLEGQPLWRFEGLFVALVLPQVLASLAIGVYLAFSNRDWLRRWWLEYSFVLFAATFAGLLTMRSLAIASVLGSVALGWAVAQLMVAMSNTRKPLGKMVVAFGIMLTLVPAFGLGLAQPVIARVTDEGGNSQPEEDIDDSLCDLSLTSGALQHLPPSLVLSQIDLGPAILANTRHRVLATGHHRGQLAMRDTIRVFTLPSDEVRPLITRINADYVLTCTGLNEMAVYRDKAPRSALAWRLHNGQPPNWLIPIDGDGLTEGFKVWRVDKVALRQSEPSD